MLIFSCTLPSAVVHQSLGCCFESSNPGLPYKTEAPVMMLHGADSSCFLHQSLLVLMLASTLDCDTGVCLIQYPQLGTCVKLLPDILQGEECPYSHDDIIEPCKQLVLNGICRFGENCHFSHDSLPEYAVEPLQEWFREQDQVKSDRTARLAEEQNASQQSPEMAYLDQAQTPGAVVDPDAQSTQKLPQQDRQQDRQGTLTAACLGNADGQNVSLEAQHCPQTLDLETATDQATLQPACSDLVDSYESWTDGWQRLYASRLQALKTATPKSCQQTGNGAAAALEPLQGPYTSWQDGWNRLFANQKQQTST